MTEQLDRILSEFEDWGTRPGFASDLTPILAGATRLLADGRLGDAAELLCQRGELLRASSEEPGGLELVGLWIQLTSREAMAPTPYTISNLLMAIAAYDTAGTLTDFDWDAALQAGGQIRLQWLLVSWCQSATGDQEGADHALSLAAENGNAYAMYLTGEALLRSAHGLAGKALEFGFDGLPAEDLKAQADAIRHQAMALLLTAAESAEVMAMHELACELIDFSEDYGGEWRGQPVGEVALAWLLEAAQRGDVVSMTTLAQMLDFGMLPDPSLDGLEARRWHQRAAAAGSRPDIEELVRKAISASDYPWARDWVRELDAKGDGWAMLLMAEIDFSEGLTDVGRARCEYVFGALSEDRAPALSLLSAQAFRESRWLDVLALGFLARASGVVVSGHFTRLVSLIAEDPTLVPFPVGPDVSAGGVEIPADPLEEMRKYHENEGHITESLLRQTDLLSDAWREATANGRNVEAGAFELLLRAATSADDLPEWVPLESALGGEVLPHTPAAHGLELYGGSAVSGPGPVNGSEAALTTAKIKGMAAKIEGLTVSEFEDYFNSLSPEDKLLVPDLAPTELMLFLTVDNGFAALQLLVFWSREEFRWSRMSDAERKAIEDEPTAFYWRGCSAFEGGDFDRGLALWRAAAATGRAGILLCGMGVLLSDEYGEPTEEFRDLLHLAAEAGDGEAMYLLGVFAAAIDNDSAGVEHWLRQSATAPSPSCSALLALTLSELEDGPDVGDLLRRLSKLLSPEGAAFVHKILLSLAEFERGDFALPTEFAHMLEPRALEFSGEQCWIMHLSLSGSGAEDSAVWLDRAVELEFPPACLEQARLLHKSDPATARGLLLTAAGSGDAEAMMTLALLSVVDANYEVTADYVHWMSRAQESLRHLDDQAILKRGRILGEVIREMHPWVEHYVHDRYTVGADESLDLDLIFGIMLLLGVGEIVTISHSLQRGQIRLRDAAAAISLSISVALGKSLNRSQPLLREARIARAFWESAGWSEPTFNGVDGANAAVALLETASQAMGEPEWKSIVESALDIFESTRAGWLQFRLQSHVPLPPGAEHLTDRWRAALAQHKQASANASLSEGSPGDSHDELANLLAEIRNAAGDPTFGSLPTVQDILESVPHNEAIVVLMHADPKLPLPAAARWRPWALVIADGTVDAVRLDGVSLEDLAKVRSLLFDGTPQLSPSNSHAVSHQMKVGLRWISANILQYVVEAIGGREAISWVATGQFAGLPLQAAALPTSDETTSSELLDGDELRSTNGPSLAELPSIQELDAWARELEESTSQERGNRTLQAVPYSVIAAASQPAMLRRLQKREVINASVIAVPEAVGPQPRIPGVVKEARMVGQLLGEDRCSLTLRGAKAETVLGQLSEHGLLHFAGHATVDGLQCQDRILTLDEISSGITNGPKDLAYLSACSTITPGPVDPDLTVAAFLQIAGFNNVVATLGPVRDGAAVEMAEVYYESWLHDQGNPSKALLNAVEACVAKYPNQPWRWAYWVHAGSTSQRP